MTADQQREERKELDRAITELVVGGPVGLDHLARWTETPIETVTDRCAELVAYGPLCEISVHGVRRFALRYGADLEWLTDQPTQDGGRE